MLLFSVPLRALAEGTLILSADAADVLPLHQVLVYRSNDPVTGDRIQFGTVVLQISAAASIQDAGALLESAATSEGDTAAAALLGLLDQSPASLAGADLATPLTGALDHRWALATAEVLSGTGAIGVTSTPSEESISDDEEPAEGASEEAEDAATIVPPLL
jgi:hypothetical protein